MRVQPALDRLIRPLWRGVSRRKCGALGYSVPQAMGRGIGFTHDLAAANSADVDVCDYVSYLAEDDETRSIICLFEGIKGGGRFLRAARKAGDSGKALIVYKAGTMSSTG